MTDITHDPLTHTDGCVGVELDDECEAARGDWNQPADRFVRGAREQLKEEYGEEIPWCRVHERAWSLAEQD